MKTDLHLPEILAPVGGREQLIAAVNSGADAVYFGAGDFNARRNAENFGDDDFIAAVRYCRERGVKAYITLNTLLTDGELPAFLGTLYAAAQAGADAVLVQDLAAAAAVKLYRSRGARLIYDMTSEQMICVCPAPAAEEG